MTYLLSALLAAGGVAHFARPALFRRMMPLWVPNHKFWVAASGVAELALAVGLLLPATQKASAWATLAIARQPVPVQGRPYRIIEEEVTEEQAEEVAEKLTQEAAEADIVAVEAENEERERLKEEAAAEAAEKADAAAGQGEDATDEGDSSPTGDVTSEAAMDDRSGTAGTEAGTEADPEL